VTNEQVLCKGWEDHPMTRKALSGLLLAGLLLAGPPAMAQKTKENSSHSESARAKRQTTSEGPDLARVKELIFTATNQFRRQEGRGELRLNPELGRAAQYFADYLARTDKFSHTADGKEPWERAARFGYAYSIVAENIAWEFNSAGFTTRRLAKAFVEGWKKSPGHRKNMLDPDVDEIGVGVARSAKTGRYYAVQDFGRPKSREITFKITNVTDGDIKYRVDGKPFTLQPSYTVTHQRGRPPKLTIDTGETSAEKEPVYHPGNGDHFTVRKGKGGRLIVEEE
jgi:uncharacterized protein YkwD